MLIVILVLFSNGLFLAWLSRDNKGHISYLMAWIVPNLKKDQTEDNTALHEQVLNYGSLVLLSIDLVFFAPPLLILAH